MCETYEGPDRCPGALDSVAMISPEWAPAMAGASETSSAGARASRGLDFTDLVLRNPRALQIIAA